MAQQYYTALALQIELEVAAGSRTTSCQLALSDAPVSSSARAPINGRLPAAAAAESSPTLCFFAAVRLEKPSPASRFLVKKCASRASTQVAAPRGLSCGEASGDAGFHGDSCCIFDRLSNQVAQPKALGRAADGEQQPILRRRGQSGGHAPRTTTPTIKMPRGGPAFQGPASILHATQSRVIALNLKGRSSLSPSTREDRNSEASSPPTNYEGVGSGLLAALGGLNCEVSRRVYGPHVAEAPKSACSEDPASGQAATPKVVGNLPQTKPQTS